jgi:septal ring factor EnvC (AmiA/AmiB activator)
MLFTRLTVLLLALSLSSAGVCADDTTQASRELGAVRGSIKQLQSRIAEQQKEKGSVADELREVELAISATTRELRELGEAIEVRRAEIDALRARSVAVSRQLEQHRDSLRKQIRAAYRLGQTPMLQLLLNQEDLASVSRALRYYDYYNHARLDAIDQTQALLGELDELAAREQAATAELAKSREQAAARYDALSVRQRERQTLLAKLEQQINSGDNRLESLREDERRLERLLDELSELLADIPPPPREAQPFRKLRGKLPWPSSGRIVSGFNSQRGDSSLRLHGVLIGAKEGSDVRAVHHGHVVFADWLQGFGLITIVDHGAGYMSLYGNNAALHKDVGDWVTAGESLATAGAGGGQLDTGVYFEIRRNGRALDPRGWLRRGG